MGAFTFGWAFTLSYPWVAAAVCALDWFLVNLLNRVVDIEEDSANGIYGVETVARRRRLLLVTGLGVLSGSLLLLLPLAPALAPLRLAYHLLGVTYNWRLLPGRRRIKELYFWKNTASAVGFLITVIGYPLAVAWWRGQGLAPDVSLVSIAVAAAFFFLFELSYEVIYDLRDVPGDAAVGVRTYPVVHGVRAGALVAYGLIGGSAAVIAAGWILGALPWRIFIMVCAPLIQLLVFRRAVKRGISSADCIGLTWLGTLLLVAYHIWVVLDLPGARLP
jgi:4-hydroxybenzoate polyprenyltransferase